MADELKTPTIQAWTLRRRSSEGYVDLRKRRAWFDDDGSQGQPNDPGQTAPTTPPAQETTPGGQSDTRSFTQAELDKMFADRAKQAEKSAEAKFLKALGVDNLDSLKTLLKEANTLKQAQMSETEKLQAAADGAAKRAAELEAALNAERQARLESTRDAAILEAAKGAEIPADVIVWAKAHAAEDLAKTLNDDGTINTGAVKALAEKCRKERPGWFTAGGPGSPSNAGGKLPDRTKDQKQRGLNTTMSAIKRGGF